MENGLKWYFAYWLIFFWGTLNWLGFGPFSFFLIFHVSLGRFVWWVSETCFYDLTISQKTFFKKCLLTVERDGKSFMDSVCFVWNGSCWNLGVAFSALSTGVACAKELKNAVVWNLCFWIRSDQNFRCGVFHAFHSHFCAAKIK